jgi:hypothetical protein
MNYKLAMAIVGELQTLLALLQSPDARWEAVQDWLNSNSRWGKRIKSYLRASPDDAVKDLKRFLIEQTEIPQSIAALAITPQIEAQARSAIERLQTLYRERANHNQSELQKEIKHVRRKKIRA